MYFVERRIYAKNDAVSEKEIDGVSGGAMVVKPNVISAVIACPFCRSPLVSSTGGNNYVCLDCSKDFSL